MHRQVYQITADLSISTLHRIEKTVLVEGLTPTGTLRYNAATQNLSSFLRFQREASDCQPVKIPKINRSDQLVGIALVNLATFTWASNIVLGRWLRAEIGPFTLAAGRFVVASVVFAALLQREAPEARHPGADRWLLLIMSVAGVALFAPLQYLGLHFTTALDATLIQALAPLITGLLAGLLIAESMSRYQVAGALVALVGVLVLISGGSLTFSQNSGSALGNLIILVAVSLWSLYTVLSRRATSGRSVLSATALSTILGLPFLLVAMVLEWHFLSLKFTPALLLVVVYVGVSPTVIGFLAWNAGVRRLGPSGVMAFYNTLPLYGVLLASLFLGEEIGLATAVGGAMIIGGGIWAARARARAARAVGSP